MSETQCENQSQTEKQKELIMMKKWYNFETKKDCANYLWEISNFKSLMSTECKSNEFTSIILKSGWCLYFIGVQIELAGVFQLVKTNLKSSDHTMLVRCRLDFLNDKHKILKSEKSSIHEVNIKTDRFEVMKIPLVGGKPDDSLLNQGKLIVRCEVQFCEDNWSVETSNTSNVNEERFSLSEDFGILWKNGLFCDITLSVEGTQFQAHRTVLTARSSVFAAMFNHPMKENVTNNVEIVDINVKVLEEMLCFIYTEKCENLDLWADQLLVAADKYDIKGLKVLCEQVLERNLTVENAADILVLADSNRADGLKSSVIEFIVVKSNEVMSTSAWKMIVLENPSLTLEVCKAVSSRLADVLL